MSGSATPMYFSGTRASSESGEVGMYMQSGDFGSQGSFPQDNGYGTQAGQMQGIQEQSAYHHNYGQGDFQINQGQGHYHQEVTADGSLYQNQYQDVTDGSQGHQTDGNQWQQYTGGDNQHQQIGNQSQTNWNQGIVFVRPSCSKLTMLLVKVLVTHHWIALTNVERIKKI